MRRKRVKQFVATAGFSCGLAVTASFLIVVFQSCAAFNKWLEAESYYDFSPRKELDRLTLRQLQEYAANGSFSSKLTINAECYDDGTTEILSSTSIINTIRFTSCRDLGPESSTSQRLFIIDSSRENLKKVARVSCRGLYFGDYLIAQNEETMPTLSASGTPSCPPEYGGDTVQPDYDEYLIWDGEVIAPREQIKKAAQQQIKEFFEAREKLAWDLEDADPRDQLKKITEKQIQDFFKRQNVSSQSATETACYKSWTEVSEDNGIVTNFIAAKPCFGLSLQSYVSQVIPDQYVGYSDYNHDDGRWESAHIDIDETTCIGRYSSTQLQELRMANLSQRPLDRPEYESPVYIGWCPNDMNGEIVFPQESWHRLDLEDEPIPSDLPVPPRRPDSGFPNI